MLFFIKEMLKVFLFTETASTRSKKGAALNGSKQMTITSMSAKTSSKKKSDKCQVPENGLHEKEQNMEELTLVQDSVGKKAIETADTELQVEKKVKLSGGDPEDETLVSIILFCSFSVYTSMTYVSNMWQIGCILSPQTELASCQFSAVFS
jgi:hypothetical protein